MFPETEAWLTARLRYTRSSAVMSMVGYVLGYVYQSLGMDTVAMDFYDFVILIRVWAGWAIGMERTFHSKREPAASCMLISIVSLIR